MMHDADSLARSSSSGHWHDSEISAGHCLCGFVVLEIRRPAFWAWHDHSPASRTAHGAAYATYAGVWRKRLRITSGEDYIVRYVDPDTGDTRSFCERCGTPLLYERASGRGMVNVPRALFDERVGREPKYHRGAEEMVDWIYRGEATAPLKGFPGITTSKTSRRR